ncbi:excinuclease ABC subunit UvrA [Reichenbachiella agarivorans]|uniref:UvrABC system protein A n=1 Tax=Reichenbachiella agarivorans TaxID=2979464 RepID=A0ABY6CSH4_9BACT|nr:excinuclease ABC subunit UvrA [Reichenbachiella agarivorans]UXP33476.1 excinuclease ABC subunit UvrA [Reichenbachiella agarivorans]
MAKKENQVAKYDVDQLDPKQFILVKGARVNNLKNLSVAIPRNKLVVITGLSGSGKSSLAFDTLFAEGQRKYVESLSSYARQFLGRMEKPEVDYIKGISPAVAIEQKVNTRNPRSTVGTSTEIYDYIKLLFARIGQTISPISGEPVRRDTVTSVVNAINGQSEDLKFMIATPLTLHDGRNLEDELNILLSKGFTRVLVKGEVEAIEDLDTKKTKLEEIEILIDRLSVKKDDEDANFRLADSVQTAFFEGNGYCHIHFRDQEVIKYSDKFELDGITFEEPSINLFSFNNPYGACRRCEGFGKVLGIDPDLVISDRNLSVFDNAIVPWRSEAMKKWLKPLLDMAHKIDFPIHRPVKDLSEEQYEMLWEGKGDFEGINAFFSFIESQLHKIQYRVMLSRYRGKTTCPDCKGTRLRKDANYVKIGGKSISELVLMPLGSSYTFFENLELSAYETEVSKRILLEIKNRLGYMMEVGLGYLTLNRLTSTLSGGEYQRIKLATSLGSALVGSMYILDEPSIGLHPRDTARLGNVLSTLKNLGNTVVVVEHEEEVMRRADQIIDIGPAAGIHGGELVFQGNWEDIMKEEKSITARFLNGKEKIPVPSSRRPWTHSIDIFGARENNLQNLDVKIPLGVLTVVTGVSGSGKSTLIRKILYPALGKMFGVTGEETGKFSGLDGDYNLIQKLEMIDQNPLGRSSRSNPVTYVKAYDAIRTLFAELPLAKQRGLKPAHFSFNVEGGRCETCQGEGEVKIEMQFMADLHLTCDECKGKRFKEEVLAIEYKDKNIADILDLSIEESLEFFEDQKPIYAKLKPLSDVGLGYVKLGQSSNSLSGGEAQRVKLASFLGRGQAAQKEKILFIFDEPTTGLHFKDIEKLLASINALVDQGSTAVIIEHNMEIIKSSDWIIDLGPEGGDGGGTICFEGTPEEMIKLEGNYTADYLKEKLL